MDWSQYVTHVQCEFGKHWVKVREARAVESKTGPAFFCKDHDPQGKAANAIS